MISVAIVLAALGIGFILGQVFDTPRSSRALEPMRSLPPIGNDCVPATVEEQDIYELALAVIRQSAAVEAQGGSVLWIGLGATRFLSHGVFRRTSDKSFRVCPPKDLYLDVARTFDANRTMLLGRLTETELQLFAKFPPGAYFVERVAESAFNDMPQPSESPEGRDVRPYARSVLATFGDASKAYSQTAFEQMTNTDSMGTGAAQIAAATHHPNALVRTEALMRELLSSTGEGDVVPWETKYRLYELAHAIRLGGDAGKLHTAPLHDLMKRKVQSLAPPFGMIELNPKQMCAILKAIEGEAALVPYRYCNDDSASDR